MKKRLDKCQVSCLKKTEDLLLYKDAKDIGKSLITKSSLLDKSDLPAVIQDIQRAQGDAFPQQAVFYLVNTAAGNLKNQKVQQTSPYPRERIKLGWAVELFDDLCEVAKDLVD